MPEIIGSSIVASAGGEGGSSRWETLIGKPSIDEGRSPESIIEGTSCITGCRGFNILAIDPAGYDSTETAPTEMHLTLDSVEGLAVEDYCSVAINKNYMEMGKITNISENTITINAYPDDLTAAIISTTVVGGGDKLAYVFVSTKQNIGTTIFGSAQHAEGYETAALMISAHAEGAATIASGKYSHAEGDSTFAGYAAHAEGQRTKALGGVSHAEGSNTTASGVSSHAEGQLSISSGSHSHAEGYQTTAEGNRAHSEGYKTSATGTDSHSEGSGSNATGEQSHAEGQGTVASAWVAHAEGYKTTASKNKAHAEGDNTEASGESSHAEGHNTVASGYGSHAEGFGTNLSTGLVTQATALAAHAEGKDTTASGEASHAEGYASIASGKHSHAEGCNIKDANSENMLSTHASGIASHAEGAGTSASGHYSHAEGNQTKAEGSCAHAEGTYTTASAQNSHAEGAKTVASGTNGAHAEGFNSVASGTSSHAEGDNTKASGNFGHSEGVGTHASGYAAHAEGQGTIASGNYSHTEGLGTKGIGDNSHAEGNATKAYGISSHAEGLGTSAGVEGETSESAAHAEGKYAKATGDASHAEGNSTEASGAQSHAEGLNSKAKSPRSHAEGWGTITSTDSQHVQGKFNELDTSAAHIVGWGSSDTDRKNIHTVSTSGGGWYSKDIRVGGTSYNNATPVALSSEVSKKLDMIDTSNIPESEMSLYAQTNTNKVVSIRSSQDNKVGCIPRYVDVSNNNLLDQGGTIVVSSPKLPQHAANMEYVDNKIKQTTDKLLVDVDILNKAAVGSLYHYESQQSTSNPVIVPDGAMIGASIDTLGCGHTTHVDNLYEADYIQFDNYNETSYAELLPHNTVKLNSSSFSGAPITLLFDQPIPVSAGETLFASLEFLSGTITGEFYKEFLLGIYSEDLSGCIDYFYSDLTSSYVEHTINVTQDGHVTSLYLNLSAASLMYEDVTLRVSLGKAKKPVGLPVNKIYQNNEEKFVVSEDLIEYEVSADLDGTNITFKPYGLCCLDNDGNLCYNYIDFANKNLVLNCYSNDGVTYPMTTQQSVDISDILDCDGDLSVVPGDTITFLDKDNKIIPEPVESTISYIIKGGSN